MSKKRISSKMFRTTGLIMGLFIVSGLFWGQAAAQAGELNPARILELADQARGNVKGVKWRIDLTSQERERVQKQSLCIEAKDFNCLATTLAPPKLKGRKLLMLDRNMWFIKPGLRKPVPISSRQKLMGGASNGDLASTNYAGDYVVKNITREKLDGDPCWVIDLKGKTKKVTYDRIRYWVSESRMVGVKAQFFTVSGKLLKTAVFEYKNRINTGEGEHAFISRMTIKDQLLKTNTTTMDYSRVEIKEIPASTFNLNLLVR
ncbi:outer membrane lipoprotein-sorting protein [Dethiosulfatarculus sandiegensis]|nr:outer membrane lipoprotein-sorting protein [Dethiosulfatarculus sandiegensis]